MHTSTVLNVLVGISLGISANVLADVFLAHDPLMCRPWNALHLSQCIGRFVRWLVSSAALGVCAVLGVQVDRLVALAFMTVTAITDLECRILPPPWFIYASILTSMLIAGLSRGLDAGLNAAIAQGLCFSIGVFTALWSRHYAAAGMDPGDIRTLMQMGATAGSFAGIVLAVMGIAIVGLFITLAGVFMRRRVHAVPLATVAWCGLAIVPLMLAVLQDGLVA